MASKYDGLARIIIQNIGGAGNVDSVAHCITRLRFKLKDESLANDEILEGTEGVVKIMRAGGQYQVVIGPHVTEVYDAVLAVGKLTAAGEVDEAGASVGGGEPAPVKKESPLSIAIDLISGILQPVLPVLAAAGMTKGLLSLCAFFGWLTKDSGTYTVLCSFADGVFYFLPIFLGITAARKFKMNEYVGAAIGAALCFPAMVGITAGDALGTVLTGTPFEMSYFTTFLGLPIIMPASGYTSSVIPAVVAVWCASIFYRKVNDAVPAAVRFFLVPMLTLLLFVPLTYIVIGPFASLLTNALTLLFQSIYEIPVVGSVLCGAVLGGIYQVMVIFGLHWACVPIVLNNLAVLGFDAVLSGREVCSFAQTAASFAIFAKTRDKKLKAIALPAAITAFFGTTEPSIYGVTLPKKKPFIISCIASAIGGGFVGLMGVKKFTSGFSGILGLPIFVDPSGAEGITNVIWLCVGILITMAITFVGVYATYKDDCNDEAAAEQLAK